MTKNRLLALVAGAAMLALIATLFLIVMFVPQWRSPRLGSALAGAKRNACPSNFQLVPGSYHVLVQAEYPAASVVLYIAECSAVGQANSAANGYQILENSGLFARSGCGGGGSGTIGLLHVHQTYCSFQSSPGGVSLVWGQVPTGTHAVNVVFADSRVVSATIASGYFAAVLPDLAEPCAVLAMDKHLVPVTPALELPGGSAQLLPVGAPACP